MQAIFFTALIFFLSGVFLAVGFHSETPDQEVQEAWLANGELK